MATSIGELVDTWGADDPARIVLAGGALRLSGADLRDRTQRLACGFRGLGVRKGEAVLLQLPNWPEFVLAYFALQKIGAVPVLLIAGHRRAEVDHLCSLTQAAAWIVPQLYRHVDYRPCIAAVTKANPQLRHVISVGAGEDDSCFSASLESLLGNGDGRGPDGDIAAAAAPSEVAHILPSGGTTGFPKAIPRSHADYLCNVRCLHDAGEMTRQDVCLLAVPVGHNLALLNMVGAALVGYRLVLLDSTRPDDICRAIQSEQITYMPTVPSLIKRVLDFNEIDHFDLRSLRKVSAGGEPMGPDLAEHVRRRLACELISEFGMSEGPLCRTRLGHDHKTFPGTVGTPVCADDEFKILDGGGNTLPAEVDGELAARGPGIFRGYLNSPQDNARAFTPDGFFRTGDLARIDRRGNIMITGRIKDVINRGGEKVSPAQVEKILLAHPNIADAAVVGMPDDALGERVCAYVRPAPGTTLDFESIKTFMESAGASRFLIPDRVEFIAALPMTEAGKHDKKLLRQDIEQKINSRARGS